MLFRASHSREIEILHSDLSRNRNQYPSVTGAFGGKKEATDVHSQQTNARLDAWHESCRSSTIIRDNDPASEDIKYLSRGKVASLHKKLEGGLRPYLTYPPFLLCVSLTWTNCLSRDILALLRLPVPITRGENARISLSSILLSSPYISVRAALRIVPVHPRRRVKLQILHPFARVNTLPPHVARKLALPLHRTRRTKGAFEIRLAGKSFSGRGGGGVVTPLAKLAPGVASLCSLPTFTSAVEIFIFVSRHRIDSIDPSVTLDRLFISSQ